MKEKQKKELKKRLVVSIPLSALSRPTERPVEAERQNVAHEANPTVIQPINYAAVLLDLKRSVSGQDSLIALTT